MTAESVESLKTLGYVGTAAAQPVVQDDSQDGVPATPSLAFSRKLIRKGQLAIRVVDFAEAAKAATRIAESYGGYIADSRASRDDAGRQRGQVTLRVSADRFAAAFVALKALGQPRSESVNSEDITKAYADLETRLRVKRETEARLREILRTRAAKLSEILEAERELARVIEEIEQMEGERRFYDQQVALSTITVEMFEPDAIVRAGILEPVREALHESLEVLANSLAALVYAVVFLTPWLLVASLVWRVVRAIRRRSPAKAG